MMIYVNDNIDEYKEDFYKGLTLKQTVTSVAAVLAGTLAFLLFYMGLGIPQNVSFYLAMPVVLPIAASGFVKIKGMTIAEYLKLKRKVRAAPVYYYRPQMFGMLHEKSVQPVAKKGRKQKIYLDDQEDLNESDEGL